MSLEIPTPVWPVLARTPLRSMENPTNRAVHCALRQPEHRGPQPVHPHMQRSAPTRSGPRLPRWTQLVRGASVVGL